MSALQGIAVLDLSLLAPGPYATMLLADLGADVLCIERPSNASATSGGALSRNKRSMCLDLKRDEGRAIIVALAQKSDVLVEGFRPGVAARLGVDHPTLSALNPRIVCCSVTGYGQDGPYAALAGHDINYIAVGGALSMMGAGPAPALPMNFIGDYAGGGLMAAVGILSALVARERTGRGQHVDVAMTDGTLALLTRLVGQHHDGAPIPLPGSHFLNGARPYYGVYECSDRRFISVGALEPQFYRRLCAALDLHEHADHQDDAGRWPAIRDAFAARFLERSRDAWFAILRDADACAAPVLDLGEALADPHNAHRRATSHGVAPKLSDTPGGQRTAPPRLGEHTDEVLRDLGHDPDIIARLRTSGVVA